MALNRPLKQMTRSAWRDYYSDPRKFADLFTDYTLLRNQEKRASLSSSQRAQMNVCMELIDGKML